MSYRAPKFTPDSSRNGNDSQLSLGNYLCPGQIAIFTVYMGILTVSKRRKKALIYQIEDLFPKVPLLALEE